MNPEDAMEQTAKGHQVRRNHVSARPSDPENAMSQPLAAIEITGTVSTFSEEDGGQALICNGLAKPTPTPYIARLYLKQKWSRFTWTFGKVSAADFFDQNTYSHDPRVQFQNWSIMYNGAWDYP